MKKHNFKDALLEENIDVQTFSLASTERTQLPIDHITYRYPERLAEGPI